MLTIRTHCLKEIPTKWTYRKSWILDAWSGRLDSGRLDSGPLDAWTLDVWTLDAWLFGLWTSGRLDSGCLGAWTLDDWTLDAWMLGLCTGVFRIFTTTVEHLNFTEHSHLLQIFTGLYTERTLFYTDKANRNLKSY